MCAVSSTSARARRRLELPPELLGRPSFADQFDDALPELRWVWPTALRHRGCSFPPQPWGVHETGSTPPRLLVETAEGVEALLDFLMKSEQASRLTQGT